MIAMKHNEFTLLISWQNDDGRVGNPSAMAIGRVDQWVISTSSAASAGLFTSGMHDPFSFR